VIGSSQGLIIRHTYGKAIGLKQHHVEVDGKEEVDGDGDVCIYMYIDMQRGRGRESMIEQ